MKKFTEIEQFRHVVKSIKYLNEGNHILPTLPFIGTVKLHGTNAGLRRINGKIQPQSRTSIIDSSNDNAGFAKWIETLPTEMLNQLFDWTAEACGISPEANLTIFGEWIGPGIQKGCGIHQLDQKHWVLFNAFSEEVGYFDLPKHVACPDHNIYNIAIGGVYRIVIDFNHPEDALDHLNNLTLQIENECPYAKAFGISGLGEGIVWKCALDTNNTNLWFKTKGEKHSGKSHGKKKIATITPEKLESIERVLDEILPSWRLEQGISQLKEKGLDIDMKNIGPYLAWIGQDIKKEESDILEANDLEWKDVVKFVTQRAKAHFMNEVDLF